jgi:hypothetical protein
VASSRAQRPETPRYWVSDGRGQRGSAAFRSDAGLWSFISFFENDRPNWRGKESVTRVYAKDRDLIPSRTDAAARAFYDQGYGVRPLDARLLDDKAHYPDTTGERRGAWSRLLALFRLVHQGDSTGNWIRGRGAKLFDTAEFPFVQGQEQASDPPSPAAVSDGCILRILDLLLNLGGDKLSFRTLDVEQIGSVYETVMGFTIETRTGAALAIRAGKNDRTPVFVDIASLAAKRGLTGRNSSKRRLAAMR